MYSISPVYGEKVSRDDLQPLRFGDRRRRPPRCKVRCKTFHTAATYIPSLSFAPAILVKNRGCFCLSISTRICDEIYLVTDCPAMEPRYGGPECSCGLLTAVLCCAERSGQSVGRPAGFIVGTGRKCKNRGFYWALSVNNPPPGVEGKFSP